MKYAIMGDIHANLEALQAVLNTCQGLGVEKYLCIGDIVGYNANPSETLELVRSLNMEVVIKGNHDEESSLNTPLIGFNPQAAQAIHWTREQLSAEQKSWLAKLPLQKTLGPKMTVVHATLDMPEKWGYIFDSLSAEASLHYQFTQVCFFGHTHVPLAFEKFGGVTGGQYAEINVQAGHKYLVNVGSVGQPRDGDARSAFVTFSTDDMQIKLHRVEYDIEACQKKIFDAGLPERLAHRLSMGR